LQTAQAAWLTDIDRAQLGEEANRMTRILEDLDTARDRAAVTQEEVASRLSELTNKRLYVLSIIAAIFLPMSFVTGLWGINTGGIPLASHGDGFLLLSAALTLMLGFQLLIFRWMKWL
jgi:zinc transporter